LSGAGKFQSILQGAATSEAVGAHSCDCFLAQELSVLSLTDISQNFRATFRNIMVQRTFCLDRAAVGHAMNCWIT